MNNQWMKRTLLVMSIQLVIGSAYAADEKNVTDVAVEETASDAVADASADVAIAKQEVNAAEPVADKATINKDETPSLKPVKGSQAANALQKQEGDATQETNLQEVFTSNERQYSLIKKNEISTFYDLD